MRQILTVVTHVSTLSHHEMMPISLAVIALTVAAAGCASERAAESYGFVATFGTDTVSVERVTRTASTLISDEVDRFPFIRQRHMVFDLTPDGKLSGKVMDVRTPCGATPAERGRRVTARFTSDSALITIADSVGTRRTALATHGALTVPHVSMMYSVIELEVATALAHAADAARTPDSGIVYRQFYPDRNLGPSFVLHLGTVYPRGNNSVELRHDWLAGRGDITIDCSRRMLRYSGMRSTCKVSVRRTTEVPDVASIVVDYGRPLARARTLRGNVIELGRVWRTAANAATQFATTAAITFRGLRPPAGTYTLWTVPHAHSVHLIVNNRSGQWGTQYDGAHDVGTMLKQTDSTSAPIEQYAIGVVSRDKTRGTRTIEWGLFRWLVPLAVS